MTRRYSFLSAALKVGAAAARHHAASVRRQKAAAARAARERERVALKRALSDASYADSLSELEADEQTAQLADHLEELSSLLVPAVLEAKPIDFQSLKGRSEPEPFRAPTDLLISTLPPVLEDYLPAPLVGLQALLPSARRGLVTATELAEQRFDEDLQKHTDDEALRQLSLAAAEMEHRLRAESSCREVDELNAHIDQFADEYAKGVPQAITDYCELVLHGSNYPRGFPKTHRLAYTQNSRQLVVEFELPTLDIVPAEASFKYVKSKAAIVGTPRPDKQRRRTYTSTVAQVALRTLHELFATDGGQHIDSIVFNGHVDAIDRGTGRPAYPCILTVRATRDVFERLNLAAVDPLACLKTLSASVSPSPGEVVPVRPVLDFNMVDPRFVQEADVLSTLDQRPNLMDLSPTEFESLITNLFEKMGLETRQTQASRDGGVDCVAYNRQPILGGKVVIQAKRYRNTVGVGAVRDLFGTMQNEGASKGILVTTSGYGRAAFEFANGKPLELLDGAHLLYLLDQHAGMKARIEVPESWKDPIVDVEET